MIAKFFSVLFKLVITLVNVILYPIDAIIATALPDVSSALTGVGQSFQELCNYIPWAVSYFALKPWVWSLLVAYMTFKLTVPYLVHAIKLALEWYDKLKP